MKDNRVLKASESMVHCCVHTAMYAAGLDDALVLDILYLLNHSYAWVVNLRIL